MNRSLRVSLLCAIALLAGILFGCKRNTPTNSSETPKAGNFIEGTVNQEQWRMEEDVACQTSGKFDNPDGTQEMLVSISGIATVDDGGVRRTTSSFSLLATAKGRNGLMDGQGGAVSLTLPSLGPRYGDSLQFTIDVSTAQVTGTFSFVAVPNVIGDLNRYPVQGSFSAPLKE
jgi:hypothetical protein